MLGNHTDQNHTIEKRKRMLENPAGKNPFIDPDEWNAFLNKMKVKFNEMIEGENSV